MTAATPNLRGHYLEMPEGRLHVWSAGAAGPPVLLLSGAGIDHARLSWRHLLPALAPHHRVLALDWPKQGLSRPWNGRATHERMLRCVVETLDAFEIERAHVVGLSQGGALTLATAIEHPERVDRIVALAPAGIISFPPVIHQLLWLTAKSRLLNHTLPTMTLRTRKGIARFARHALFAGRPPEDFEAIVDAIVEEVERSGAASSDWQNDSIGFLRMNVDLRPRLSEISAPTLFIQGDRDIGVRPGHTIEAARQIPDAHVEVLEGHGHWANLQSPERVNRLILDFLRQEHRP